MSDTQTLDTSPAPEALLRVEPAGSGTWRLRAAQIIPVDRDRLFPFFADPSNLARITPSAMRFEILTRAPILMAEGTLIDYRIRVCGLPLRWRTLISRWDPPREFVDAQLRGPYATWVHRHRFTGLADGLTLMEDDVTFRLPLGRLGALVGPLVRRQLMQIFRFRARAIAELLSP